MALAVEGVRIPCFFSAFFSLNLSCSFRTLLGLRVREMGRKLNFKTKKLILKLDVFHSP